MQATTTAVRGWLRLEGFAVLALSVLFYARSGQGWFLFALLLLAPDLSILAYLAGSSWGARVYNLLHSYALPLLLIVGSLVAEWPLLQALGLIWTAHIGMDRALGYGLKFSSGFQDTHLGRIGRPRQAPTPAVARDNRTG